MTETTTADKTKEQRKADAYEEFMKDFIQGYYDTKRDEDGMADFVKLLNLGCFGREFCVYGMAYEDEYGHLKTLNTWISLTVSQISFIKALSVQRMGVREKDFQ